MKQLFFTPGPSQLYPTVKGHITKALRANILSISHRSKQYQAIQEQTVGAIRTLLTIPNSYHIFFVSSGTEAMERTIQNCVQHSSFHFVNGAFSQRFYTVAKELGKAVYAQSVPWGNGFPLSKTAVPKRCELICVTQNETSTGASIPIDEIHQLKRLNPHSLIAVDIVSSAPYVRLDYQTIDVAFFSVQKGFGLPAGLGAVIVSPQALEKAMYIREKNISIGSYHSFPSLLKESRQNQTPETPNVLGVYLLGKVCTDMATYGIDRVRQETEAKAELLYKYLDEHTAMGAFVKDTQFRSKTVIVGKVKEGSKTLIARLKAKGVVLASGYGKYKNSQFRIANYPAHSIANIKRLVKLISFARV